MARDRWISDGERKTGIVMEIELEIEFDEQGRKNSETKNWKRCHNKPSTVEHMFRFDISNHQTLNIFAVCPFCVRNNAAESQEVCLLNRDASAESREVSASPFFSRGENQCRTGGLSP